MSSSHSQDQLSVDHFRQILSNETTTLTGLCEQWSKVLESRSANCGENNNLSSPCTPEGDEEQNKEEEETLGAIRTTIGQAKLLMSQRFKQFSKLIDDCENNTGERPTRLTDLLGFWEMISYQLDDVLKKFQSLEEKSQL